MRSQYRALHKSASRGKKKKVDRIETPAAKQATEVTIIAAP